MAKLKINGGDKEEEKGSFGKYISCDGDKMIPISQPELKDEEFVDITIE